MTFHKKLFQYSYTLPGRKEIEYLDKLVLSSALSFEELEARQNFELVKFIDYCYNRIPYYSKLFKKHNLKPSDIASKDDLQKLPILTKDLIRKNYSDLIPKEPAGKFFSCRTGGSTGSSLEFRCSEQCYSLGVALMYRGWGYGGYTIGDSVFLFGGGSIVKNTGSLRTKLSYGVRNLHPYSSYGVSNEDFKLIVEQLRSLRPKFFRGYASSMFLLAQYIENEGGTNCLGIQDPRAIFTTAEMLYPNQREVIERVFNCKVFNNYGLNDGGISAYESVGIDGFLIDSERAIMESCDEKGYSGFDSEGSLIATSFRNYDFPFIRYDTGDIGVISDSLVKSGGNRLILKELLGRSNDFLELNGRVVGSPVLTVLMGKVDVLRYQIIQRNQHLEIVIEKGPRYNSFQEDFICKSLTSNLGEVSISFKYTNQFRLSENKHKFIIREDD